MLRTNHKVMTADLLHLEPQYKNTRHEEHNRCQCPTCTDYCHTGCTHPNTCLKKAALLTLNKTPKFSPPPHETDHLENKATTLEDRTAAQATTIGLEGSSFLTRVITLGEIHKHFRIFTNPTKCTLEPARWDNRTPSPPNITVFTDDSCTANGTTDACAGIGDQFVPNDPQNHSEPVGRNIQQTNMTAKLLPIHSDRK